MDVLTPLTALALWRGWQGTLREAAGQDITRKLQSILGASVDQKNLLGRQTPESIIARQIFQETIWNLHF